MNGRFWSRFRKPGSEPAPQSSGEERGDEVNPVTGEITRRAAASARQAPRPGGSASGAHVATEVAGERGVPSVARERSLRARISYTLAISALVAISAGLIAWYYIVEFSRVRDARATEDKAVAARASGELKLKPLGKVDPPMARATSASAPGAGAAPTPPQLAASAPGAYGASGAQATQGPPQKSPAELALERRLGEPVVTHGRTASPQAVSLPPPNLAALLGTSLPGAGPLRVSNESTGAGLAGMLQPTLTPAVEAQVVPTRRFLLPKGAFIDCTLETAIDSTFDGMTTCIGADDVYGADGSVVLLERGTKYIGEKRGEARLGQSRVFVLWSEARTPTGVVVKLDSPGTDELGRTGLPGHVDTHFWDRFGAAILISVIDGTLQGLAQSQSNHGGTTIQLNPTGTRDVMTEILRGTVAIPPTIVKNQGERIQVLVARDVDFRPVYALRTTDPN
jgi:type IV secretion system protein VirB10